MEKIAIVLMGVIGLIVLPLIVVTSLSRIGGIIAAAKGAQPYRLQSLEPIVKFWAGGLLLAALAVWISFIAYLIFEVMFLQWISVFFAAAGLLLLVMFIVKVNKEF